MTSQPCCVSAVTATRLGCLDPTLQPSNRSAFNTILNADRQSRRCSPASAPRASSHGGTRKSLPTNRSVTHGHTSTDNSRVAMLGVRTRVKGVVGAPLTFFALGSYGLPRLQSPYPTSLMRRLVLSPRNLYKGATTTASYGYKYISP